MVKILLLFSVRTLRRQQGLRASGPLGSAAIVGMRDAELSRAESPLVLVGYRLLPILFYLSR